MLERGYTEVSFKEKADIYIINTCAVTNTAASKSRQKIHQAHALNPTACIAVVGCYVQSNHDQVADIDGVSILVGSKGKSMLVDSLKLIYKDNQYVRKGLMLARFLHLKR